MNTIQLLQIRIEELTNVLSNMKANECERHARNVLEMLDGPVYEDVMKSIVNKLIPNDGDEKDDLLRFHGVVAKHFPHIDENNDTLGKLTFLIYMVVHKRSGLIVDCLTKTLTGRFIA